tara:strand:+ start:2917 stop:3807 length:891 start_codon:yes stop_codon:yes gene_type:complete
MSNNKADIIQEVNSRVLKALEDGTVPWRSPYKRQQSIHGHAYRGINKLMLNLAARENEYESNVWMTANAIKKKEGMIGKGEKGSRIFFNGTQTYEIQMNSGETEKGYRRISRTWFVWNVDQCTFEDDYFLEWSADPNIEDLSAEETIRQYLTKENIDLREYGGAACYSPSGDWINCPPPQALLEPKAYYPMLFHEMGHSTGHASRLGRDGITDFDGFGSHQYSQEELVAEMTSAYLCGELGVALDYLENSAAYIQHWHTALKNDSELLTRACSEAERAYQYILNGEIDGDLRENKT